MPAFRRDSGWIVEYQLPLGSLDTSSDGIDTIVPAQTGDTMLFNFAINDNDIKGAAGQDTHAMLWVVDDDLRTSFGGGENIWVVPLKLSFAADPLDCNGDGSVDIDDVNCACAAGDFEQANEILVEIGSLAGDADGNGTVEFQDFVILANNFGQVGQYTDGDFDWDGMVDFPDFVILANNFAKSGGGTGAAVPEPSILSLLLMSAVPLGAAR